MSQDKDFCPPDLFSCLSACDAKTPPWSLQGREVWAKCVSVYDGDTARLAFSPLPQSSPRVFNCRLCGYNSAELRSKDQAEKAAALAARDYLRSLILGKVVRAELGSFDKYGRILVKIWIREEEGEFELSARMLEKGFGQPYQGKGEKKW